MLSTCSGLKRSICRAQFRDDLLQLFTFAIDKHHFGASGQQRSGALQANTGGGSGDSGHFAIQGSIHGGDGVIHFIILFNMSIFNERSSH